MNPREDIDGLSKSFAHRLSAMIEAGLITYREFEPWTESLIVTMDRPPRWILDLTLTKYWPDAAAIVRRFAYSEPFETLAEAPWADDYVAAAYLRYERRELSWATFLRMAGEITDSYGGKHVCEFFYEMLNEYERSEFATATEAEQRRLFLGDEGDNIASVRSTFEAVRRFRRSPRQ